jgi:uncharacterized protein
MLIDAAVHPLMSIEAYLELLESPWRDHVSWEVLPNLYGKLFEPPFPDVADPDAASDAGRAAEVLFDHRGVDAAVLTPLTRGLLPNPQHLTAVARATNVWLKEKWLDSGRPYFGSIRVPITDVHAAVREIEMWADEPRFVQIAVPLRTFAQYGDERYFPIWKAASERGLPVFVLDDLATAAEYPHSPVGQPIHFAENDAMRAPLSLVHLLSVITSGMLDRLPALRFIFGDGGLDIALPLLWRADNEWRSGRVEIPWVTDPPSEIANNVARFVSQAQDGTSDGVHRDADLARITHAETQLIFGSHYPYWDSVDPDELTAGWSAAHRARAVAETALEVMPRLASQLRTMPTAAASAD